MASLSSLLADGVVVFHALYVLVVVGGEILVLVGAGLGWQWVRDFYFRAIHLGMIAVVVVESLVAIVCPLTDLEDWLRRQAGQTVEQGTFLGRWVHGLLFFDLPGWAFTVIYCLFGLLVVATACLIPPRWPWKMKGNPRDAVAGR